MIDCSALKDRSKERSLDPGLPVDEIEKRLVASAARHDLEERALSFFLLEIECRRLYLKKGFSSTGDYAFAVAGIRPRKAQYLIAIARRLESLPRTAAAFEAGELSWTKVREISRVATEETEAEWIGRAKRLSNRGLERAVRREKGAREQDLLHIPMPHDVMEVWKLCEDTAVRMCGCELAPYQVLEAMMAEFLSTYSGAEYVLASKRRETELERMIPEEIRRQVLERDAYQCQFPDCTMRVHLEIHHLEYRSRGGTHVASNLITLCCAHHGLVHEGICGVKGEAPDRLKWRRPYVAQQPALPAAPVTPLMEEESAPDSPVEEKAAEEITEESEAAATEDEGAAAEGAAVEGAVEPPHEDESGSESSTEGTYPSEEELYILSGVGAPSDFKHIEILVDEYEMHLALQALASDEHVFAEDQRAARVTTGENEHVFAVKEGDGAPRAEIVKSSPARKG